MRNQNIKIKREQDPIPWRYCLLTIVCGLLLMGGFFWAARQHFSAMDLGMKNAQLRKQKEILEAEIRLLERNREVLKSPVEISKAAKKIGLQDISAESVEVVSAVQDKVIPSNENAAKTFVASKNSLENTDSKKMQIVAGEKNKEAADKKSRENTEATATKPSIQPTVANDLAPRTARKQRS